MSFDVIKDKNKILITTVIRLLLPPIITITINIITITISTTTSNNNTITKCSYNSAATAAATLATIN